MHNVLLDIFHVRQELTLLYLLEPSFKPLEPTCMQKSTVIILIALLLAIAPALSGQRPGPESKPGLIKWIDDNRMLIRLYDDEKKPAIMDEANLVTKEYDCRTGKSVKVEKYRTDVQKMRDMLPEGITPGPDMAVSSDMTAVVLVRDSDIWYYSSG